MQGEPTSGLRSPSPSSPCLVLTRASEPDASARASEAGGLAAQLRIRGVQVREFALLHLLAASDPARAAEVLRRLPSYALAVVVSPAAARATAALLREPWPTGCALAAVGAASRDAMQQALRGRGQDPQALHWISAEQPAADSESLWRELQAWRATWHGVRVLVLRGDGGREWLSDILRAHGAEVQALEVYRRAPPAPDAQRLQCLRELLQPGTAWQIAADSALRNLCQLLRSAGLPPRQALASQRALVHHPRLAQAARAAGFGRVDVVTFDAEELAHALSRNGL